MSERGQYEVLVTGATSTIGSLLMPMLRARCVAVMALGRTSVAGGTTQAWHFF